MATFAVAYLQDVAMIGFDSKTPYLNRIPSVTFESHRSHRSLAALVCLLGLVGEGHRVAWHARVHRFRD